jgi:hypothetical protein
MATAAGGQHNDANYVITRPILRRRRRLLWQKDRWNSSDLPRLGDCCRFRIIRDLTYVVDDTDVGRHAPLSRSVYVCYWRVCRAPSVGATAVREVYPFGTGGGGGVHRSPKSKPIPTVVITERRSAGIKLSKMWNRTICTG